MFVFLDKLKEYLSDLDGVNGHGRIVKAHRENLVTDTPSSSSYMPSLRGRQARYGNPRHGPSFTKA